MTLNLLIMAVTTLHLLCVCVWGGGGKQLPELQIINRCWESKVKLYNLIVKHNQTASVWKLDL